jgi:DNA mismatch repair protein MutL
MGKIRVLSDAIINQIAAGEVVENPASVVKELVENALDAGASQISIEIKGGGLQLIRVTDDGSGMSPDDALLSLERHATSKIGRVEDLFALNTMGFRGEALASIAAISKLTLITAQETSGTRIEVEGGKFLRCEPAARTRGTTLEVRSLFYNVPARRKFQKSAAICSSEITRMLTALSLAYPEVGFELIQQERLPLIAKKGGTLSTRMSEILGEPFCIDLLPLHLAEGGVELSGFIGAPASARHNRTGQHLFINKRPVTAPLISYAVRDGYATRIPHHRHPIFVLHLTLPAALVDVNVHPQKREVRLREEEALREQIKKTIGKALQGEMKPEERTVFHFQEPLSEPFEIPLTLREETTCCEPVEMPFKAKPRTLGVYGQYLLLEEKEGILLVDLAAAYRSVAFEAFEKSGGNSSQGLLIPISFEVSPAEASELRARFSEIEALGIAIRSLGNHAFIIDALPPYLDPDDAKQFVLELSSEEKREKITLTATRYVKKKSFSLTEAEALYAELQKTASPKFAPDGSLTTALLSRQTLASFFN